LAKEPYRPKKEEEAFVKINPIKDHIVVKRIEESDTKKVGSIIIPDTAKEKSLTAEVIAIGSGKMLRDGKKLPMEVKVGDTVLIGKYSGSEITLDDNEYLILREDDVLGIIA
jgi:chaperonin GroES